MPTAKVLNHKPPRAPLAPSATERHTPVNSTGNRKAEAGKHIRFNHAETSNHAERRQAT
jgi:hypothetical protein